MCRTDFDESWIVFDSWWGTGRCIDCGHVGRMLYEDLGPETDEVSDFEAMFLNDGVPDWVNDDADWRAEDARYELPAKPTDTQAVCENCLEARRWLQVWCRSWVYGDYRGDIIEHWEESEIERTMPFGRLVVAAKSGWQRNGVRLDSATVATLVDRSLDRLRADTGLEHAPW